jgi:hypothetical protein
MVFFFFDVALPFAAEDRPPRVRHGGVMGIGAWALVATAAAVLAFLRLVLIGLSCRRGS